MPNANKISSREEIDLFSTFFDTKAIKRNTNKGIISFPASSNSEDIEGYKCIITSF